MIHKKTHTNRLVALFGVILGVGILFAGCDKAPETVKKPATKVESKAAAQPVTPAKTLEKQAEEVVTIEQMEATGEDKGGAAAREVDMFSLAEELRDLKASPVPSASEIERVEAALLEELEAQEDYPKQIGKNVELLAFRYSHLEGDEFEMAFAFRTNAQFGKDYHIYVHGIVDMSHINRIPKRHGKPSQLQKWGFAPEPLTSTWSPGDVIVVRNRVKAADVPYQMSVNLMYLHPDEGWQEITPKFVPLGWHAALE